MVIISILVLSVAHFESIMFRSRDTLGPEEPDTLPSMTYFSLAKRHHRLLL